MAISFREPSKEDFSSIQKVEITQDGFWNPQEFHDDVQGIPVLNKPLEHMEDLQASVITTQHQSDTPSNLENSGTEGGVKNPTEENIEVQDEEFYPTQQYQEELQEGELTEFLDAQCYITINDDIGPDSSIHPWDIE